jgi:hypothetical protein
MDVPFIFWKLGKKNKIKIFLLIDLEEIWKIWFKKKTMNRWSSSPGFALLRLAFILLGQSLECIQICPRQSWVESKRIEHRWTFAIRHWRRGICACIKSFFGIGSPPPPQQLWLTGSCMSRRGAGGLRKSIPSGNGKENRNAWRWWPIPSGIFPFSSSHPSPSPLPPVQVEWDFHIFVIERHDGGSNQFPFGTPVPRIFPLRSIHRLVVVFQVNNWVWVGGGGGWEPFN